MAVTLNAEAGGQVTVAAGPMTIEGDPASRLCRLEVIGGDPREHHVLLSRDEVVALLEWLEIWRPPIAAEKA